MSTLAEIEEAIGQLPPEQWAEIRRWMDAQMQQRRTFAVASSVDWSRSAAVRRERPVESRVTAEVMRKALATVRE